MTVLVLRLAAPMQSWGTGSRFSRRNTDRAPSKSGIVGLLAAAAGRRRTDAIDDLRALRVGVRIDQPGQLERDFQTARPVDGSKPMPLSYRFYLADAVFVAAVEGSAAVLESLRDCLRRPVFPLFLGRRSCPPTGQLVLGSREGSLAEVLETEPWQAAAWYRRTVHAPHIVLDTVLECDADTLHAELTHDEPLSFDPRKREYGWRTVLWDEVRLANPGAAAADPHAPMDLLGGAR